MKRPIIVLVVAAGVLAAGVPAAGERTPLKEKFPEAGEVIPLIEGFPLLKNLLELKDPWSQDPVAMKDRIFPRKMEMGMGTEAHPLLFINWRDFREATNLTDRPGLKVWDQWSYETDYYVFDPARPVIVMHLGRPPSCRVWNEVEFPDLKSMRSEIPAKIEKIVDGLGLYGAKKLPFEHPRIRKYLLPGGTRMNFSDFSGCVTVQGRKTYMQIQFEPARPRNVRTPLPAFPGAEGYGAFSRGGRGGKVYLVTTLEDYLPRERPGRKEGAIGQASGQYPKGRALPGYPAIPKEEPIPGSLREAVEAEGPRIVMFAVSGTIELKAPLNISNSYLTIVGHTAPGEGVQIRNWWFSISTHDVVMRYLRVRVGDIKGPGKMPRVLGDQTQAIEFTGMNLIIDHCEFAYANDQIVNIRAYRPHHAARFAYNTARIASTFQWNYVYGGLHRSVHEKGDHSMSYAFAGFGYLSLHHNLTSHSRWRNPRIAILATDWRNNTLYNYDHAGYGSDPDFLKINYVGNVQKRGKQNFHFKAGGSVAAHFHGSDNIGVGPVFIAPRSAIMDEPWNAMPIKTDSAKVAHEKVLKYGGADLPVRDVITRYVTDNTRNNTGNIPGTTDDWPHGGYATYKPSQPAPDADRDGMPDWWEKKYGLDPSKTPDNASDSDKDGYTNVEEFINDTDPTEFVDYRKPENNVHSLHRENTIHRRKK